MASLRSLWQPFIKTERPNIRKMFKPDPGYIMFEVDLKQADAQIVAWEAQATGLMDIFDEINRGVDRDVHKENAYICFASASVTPWQRQISKHVVHGTNFVGSSREVARRLGLTQSQVDIFQKRWFGRYPQIRNWHRSIEDELMRNSSVTNILGYRRMFFDRIDTILPEAVAWKPQSTTALVIDAGIRKMEATLPDAQLLMQVHDSALGQVKTHLFTETFRKRLLECYRVRLPYPRPLEMLVELKASRKSWGDVSKKPEEW